MTEIVTLEIERLEDLFNLFSGDEKGLTVAVGQLNTTNEELYSINILVSMRVQIEEGDTLVMYTEDMGNALIPYLTMKDSKKRSIQEEYKERKEKYDALLNSVKERRNKITMTIQGKGYNVIKGVWMA